jgi:membrane protein
MTSRLSGGFASATRLMRLVVARFAEDRCIQVAGNLTFTTLLALVPLFTIALTLFAAFPVFEDWSNAFKIFLLTTLVPEVGGKVITVYMQQFADNAAQLTAVGIAFLAVTALLLLMSIEKVFDDIWRARRPRTVVQRLVIYWTTLTVGPLLIGASLSITSWLVAQSMLSVGGAQDTHDFLLRVVPVLLNGAAFALLYLTVPNRRVRVRDALAGGMAAALVFEAMKRGFGLYMQLVPTYDLIYGTFAILPIFLLWLFLSWVVILLAAVLVAVLPQWRLGVERSGPGGETGFFRALRLIELLHVARRQAETPGVSRLAMRSGMTEEAADTLLEAMESKGWVRRVEPAGWILALDLASLRLADVYRLFAMDPAGSEASSGPLVTGAQQLLHQMVSDLEMPLASLWNEPTEEGPDAASGSSTAGSSAAGPG